MKLPLFTLGAAIVTLASCTTHPKPQWLMPTPRIYQNGALDPFRHLSKQEQQTTLPVYYATNRKPTRGYYGSGLDRALRFGIANVGIGRETENWTSLATASSQPERPAPVPLRLVDFNEIGDASSETYSQPWLQQLSQSSRRTHTRDVMIYVHGAKVEFFHSCAFAAEFAHFSGRSITPVAFDWPTHPEIFSYITKVDLDHGIRSAEHLAELVRMISSNTEVRKIHLLSWSAGARVLSRAMVQLGGAHPGHMRSRYRIGTAVFAAGDVPERDFIQRLPAIHDLSDQVLVYLSDNDSALKWAGFLMGGGRRLGLEPKTLSSEEIKTLENHPRLQVIDTSYGKVRRGFDISGHRYWYQHPWISSDLILTLLTAASPPARGLQATTVTGVWSFPPDYGDRIGQVAQDLTGSGGTFRRETSPALREGR